MQLKVISRVCRAAGSSLFFVLLFWRVFGLRLAGFSTFDRGEGQLLTHKR